MLHAHMHSSYMHIRSSYMHMHRSRHAASAAWRCVLHADMHSSYMHMHPCSHPHAFETLVGPSLTCGGDLCEYINVREYSNGHTMIPLGSHSPMPMPMPMPMSMCHVHVHVRVHMSMSVSMCVVIVCGDRVR